MGRSGKGIVRALLVAGLAMLAGGCGSPSSDADGNPLPTETSRTLTLAVSLVDPSGAPLSTLDAGERARVLVDADIRTVVTTGGQVTSDTTTPAANLIVTLSSPGASFEPASGSVLTDSQGLAAATLIAGSSAGAQTLSAAATVTGVGSAASTLNYAIDAATPSTLALSLLDAQGRETSTLAAGELIDVQARLSTAGGTPLSGQIVQFSSDGGLFDPASATALTGADGIATVRFQPSLSPGAYAMTVSTELAGDVELSTTSNYQIGVPRLVLGSGSPFSAGSLALSAATVRPGEPVQVSGEVRTEDGLPFLLPVDITFSSLCASAGSATLVSPVRSGDGRFSTSYTAGAGCAGQDQVTAEAAFAGQAFAAQAQHTFTILAPEAGAVRHVESTPGSIALRGRATVDRPDQAEVRFLVVNPQGVPVPGATVGFALTSAAGGLELLTPSAISDAAGMVTARVRAGSAATSFRVIATLPTQPGASAQSDAIIVSTGTPDQDSLSLSVSTFNIEGWDIDGTTTTLTVRAADFFNNPVPDGTRVSFTAEGGAVLPSCDLVGGVCSVTLSSQAPRPANGRVTVLASAPGDESFVDLDGSGQWTPGEPFDDLGEAFRDDNENAAYDIGETFLDRDGNGIRDAGNGLYDGALCGGAGGCRADDNVDVRAQAVVVLSTSRVSIASSPASLTLDELSPKGVRVLVSDLNGNLPAAGSTVAVTVSNGELLTPATFTVGNSNAPGPIAYDLLLIGDGEPSSGFLTVTVTSPSGIMTTRQISVGDISICDTAPVPLPPGCDGGDVAVAAITLNPALVLLPPNSSTTSVVQIGVFANDGRPFAGVVPAIGCAAVGSATGISVTTPANVDPTSAAGTTSVAFEVSTTALARGHVHCTVSAGEVQNTIVFEAQRLAVTRVLVNPSAFTVTPNETGLLLTARFTALAGDMGDEVPVAGVIPVVTCERGTSSEFNVIAPGDIQPTSSADGGTNLVFTLSSGAAPAGELTCTASADGVSAIMTFSP